MKKIMFILCAMMLCAPQVHASIFINEILADPAAGLEGDANADGTTSSSQDEFIELFNFSSESIDLSGWSLSDATRTRHQFDAGTILAPHQYLVIFGGGAPQLPDIQWVLASEGSLGLNNSGDTISLFDSTDVLMEQVIYGSIGGNNQSITRWPQEPGSDFALHSEIEDSYGVLFSPGTYVDGSVPDQETTAVPEPMTLALLGVGLSFGIIRKWNM